MIKADKMSKNWGSIKFYLSYQVNAYFSYVLHLDVQHVLMLAKVPLRANLMKS